MPNTESTRRLLEACKTGDVKSIKHLLEQGGDPSRLLKYESSHPTMINALHFTCMLGKLDALKILSEYCESHMFEIRGGQLGLTPLHYACLYGHFDIIQYLCSSARCNSHSKTFDGSTALHMACSCALLDATTLEIVVYLVKMANCDVNETNTNGLTPLMVLLQHGTCITVAKYLIFECSCNLLVQNKCGNTTLHIASSSGDCTIIQELFKHDEGLHSTMIANKQGDIPLHLACLHGHDKCAELLAEANPKGLHTKNISNLIPLQYALQRSPHSKLTLMLIMKMEKYLDERGNSPLHIACLIPDITLANIAAKLTRNPNIANHDGDTPLHLACRYNRHRISEILLNLESDVNILNEKGETALTVACAGNKLWLVKLFYMREKRSTNGETPFFIACKLGNAELVNQMIMAGIDFSETNNAGETPIQTAINNSHIQIVELLFKKPSELSRIDEIIWYYRRGVNPTLMLTAQEYLLQFECHELKDSLLLKEIPLKYSEKLRLTALHYACYYGHVHVVKYLVNVLHCDPNVKIFDSGLTPLHLACMAACSMENSLKIVRFLTTEVAGNCNSQTVSGDTPLMSLLSTHCSWSKHVQYLVDDCLCDLNLQNNHRATALHIACAKSSTEAVRVIIKAGANLDVRDEAGSTPLHIACIGNNEDQMKLILSQLQSRVDVVLDILSHFDDRQPVIASVSKIMHAHKDIYGNTPLHIICIKDDTKLARIVANTICTPNVQNFQCDTPLHIVCKNSCSTMAEIILSITNCDVNVKNNNGDTPLHLACRNGDMQIIDMLLEKFPDILVKNDSGRTPINELFHPNCSNMEIVWHILSHNHDSKICDISMLKYLVVKEIIDVSEFLKPDIVHEKNILHVICGQAGDIHALRFFVQMQVNISFMTLQDKRGWTPLHYACYYGRQNIVAYLIQEHSCNSVIETIKGETPLHLACIAACSEENAVQVVKFLTLKCKHDVNMRYEDGTTLLMYLLHHRTAAVDIAYHLIEECRCDLSLTKNSTGDTALHIACMICNTEVARLIIQAGGSDVASITNKNGDTPLHYACKFGCEDIAQLLITSQPRCLYEENEVSHIPLEVAEVHSQHNIIASIIYAMYDNPAVNRNTPLHIACYSQNIYLVKMIMDLRFNVTATNIFGDSPLHIAARTGNFKLVKLLIASGNCDVDSRNSEGDTPLHEASKVGHLSIVESILKQSMLPDMKNNAGLSPIHCAFIHKKFDIALSLLRWPGKGKLSSKNLEKILVKVKHLIKEGIEPVDLLQIKFDEDRKSFLHTACILGDLEAVQLLTTLSNDCNSNGWTPLHFACHHGHCDIVQYLVEEVQSNPYLAAVDDITPLQLACYSENIEIISYLLTREVCNPNLPLHNGENLLLSLVKNTNQCPMSVLQYIVIDYHCDLSVQDIEGNTALHIACQEASKLDTVKLIINRNDWPSHVKNNLGNTPLHIACEYGHTEIVKALLSTKKCDFYDTNLTGSTALEITSIPDIVVVLIQEMFIFRDRYGNTPLHTACENQNYQQIQFVIDKCSDVSVTNYNGDTPLHILCKKENCSTECMKLLITSNCNLNAKNKHGDTPLSVACKVGQYTTVKFLLADEDFTALCIKDINGDTPLHLACRSGNVCLVEFLLDKCSLYHIKEPNKSGHAPLHEAYHAKNSAIAILILKSLIVKKCFHAARMNQTVSEDDLLWEGKQLVKQGVDPMYLVWIPLNEAKMETCLHVACSKNDIEAVQLLSKSGNSEIRDAKGWTPLNHACFHGNLEIIIHLIIKANCNPDLPTLNDILPLQLACSASEEYALKIVLFLINTAKCNPDATIYGRDTLFIYLLKTNNMKMSILKFLIMDYRCSLSVRSHGGNTALHIVCSYMSVELEPHALEVIKMMATRDDCDASITNDLFDTPLHSACMDGKLSIIKALVSNFGKKCGLYGINNAGHLPLTIAFNLGHHLIASFLISVMYSILDEHDNAALHTACINEDILLAQYIVDNEHCVISATNSDGDTALHIAIRTGNHKLINAVLKTCDITTLQLCNHIGENSLHIACKVGDSSLFQELLMIKSAHRDRNDDNVFHLACKCGHTHIVDIILSKLVININSGDSNGETALHIVCKSGNNMILTLLLGKGADVTATNKDGNTPLHLACQTGSLEICEEILKKGCDINAKNKNGDTPLFIACKCCHFNILQLLINEPEIKISERNDNGDTILHALCRSPRCDSAMVRYTLEITQIDPSVSNIAGETPIQLTSNHHIIHELIRFGADPTDVYASKIQIDVKNPPQPVVKVFIIGNPSVGKSTLTAALKVELSRLAKVFTPTKRIAGVEQGTAGIIPHDFDSRKFGSVTLYDFAGHREFYSSHSALLQNSVQSSPPIFLIVVDLRENYQKLKSNILYWLAFIENQISAVNKKPHIIIVGSHADVIKLNKQELLEKEEIIKGLDYLTSVKMHGFVSMDCQYSQSPGMATLRHYIKESCEDVRVNSNIKFNAHCFLVYLYDRFKDSTAIKLDQIVQTIHKDKENVVANKPLFFLPESIQHLFDLCYELRDRGHILLLKDKRTPANSWIVIDKVSLLSEVTGSIFAPEGLRQYCNLASNTGVVPLTKLSAMFSKYDTGMLVGYLVHLEFCHEISDSEILQLVDENIQNYTSSEVYYFFPALVQLKAPNNLWAHKPHHIYYCGWILKCSRPGQFFTSRFIEVLILRLAFSFALITTFDDADTAIPVLQRKCSIWKNGIFWGDNSGVETLFEVVPDNKSVVVLMRCTMRQALKPFLQLRSSVICKVLAAVSEFCAKVDVSECFIDPIEAQQYPITINQLYSIEDISSSIINSKGGSICVVSGTGESLPLTSVLIFEPYSLLGKTVIAKIFGSGDAVIKEIPDHELSTLARITSSNDGAQAFASIFDETFTTPPSSGQMLSMLKKWKVTSDGTYLSLHQKLDPFSIFSTRNPGIINTIII